MKTQHTPGPWIVGGPVNDIGDFRIFSETKQDTLYCTVEVGWGSQAKEIAAANARLIAAAPDLLEALQAITAGVIEGLNSEGDYMHARVKEARAAIAKATSASL